MPVLIITPLITADTCDGRGRVRLGQPDVQRHEARLGAEADQRQEEAHAPAGAGAAPDSAAKSSRRRPGPSSRNIASRKAVPRCVATR